MKLHQMRKNAVAALVLLLLCLVVLISASYAWFTISTQPEITGIDTNIGANGSLEIALLNDETYLDPGTIRTAVGDSAVVQDPTVSNQAWGNIVELSNEGYGLGQISLIPTRLSIVSDGSGGGVVNGSLLNIPDYGTDGRMDGKFTDTATGVYTPDGFMTYTDRQRYGVRGVGIASDASPQQTALATARASVRVGITGAHNALENAWKANGPALLDLMARLYDDKYEIYDVEIDVIEAMAQGIDQSLEHIDSALRQGVVGFAASVIEGESEFKTVRSAVEDRALPLSLILQNVPYSLPDELEDAITLLDENRAAVRQVIVQCGDRTPRNDEEMAELVYRLFDRDRTYIDGTPLSRLDENLAWWLRDAGSELELTFTPGGGVMADIADFAGNYNVLFNYSSEKPVELRSLSTESPPYLSWVASYLDGREAALGAGALTRAQLVDLCGYAVDLAFRCNTGGSLQLQTAPEMRVEQQGADGQTMVNTQLQGGGSYLRFASEQLNTDQIVRLMNSMRVGFLDNQNSLLAVAKPNISNYTQEEDGVTAPLYLYDYTVTAGGTVELGERGVDTEYGSHGEVTVTRNYNDVTVLEPGVPAVVTVVVWLDGESVDNSMAGSTALQSVTGMLNLQFSSPSELNAAQQTVSD